MTLPTPSQTVGPYFRIGLPDDEGPHLVPPDHPHAIEVLGTLFDGEGAPVNDALVEIWQADRNGRYDHPEDTREDVPLPSGGMQAPHVDVSVFARGLLKRLVTRIYFPDEGEANDSDPVLSYVEPERRAALVAREEDGALRFDIYLQGDSETPFFDL